MDVPIWSAALILFLVCVYFSFVTERRFWVWYVLAIFFGCSCGLLIWQWDEYLVKAFWLLWLIYGVGFLFFALARKKVIADREAKYWRNHVNEFEATQRRERRGAR